MSHPKYQGIQSSPKQFHMELISANEDVLWLTWRRSLVLLLFNLIPQRSHQWLTLRSQFRDSEILTRSSGDDTVHNNNQSEIISATKQLVKLHSSIPKSSEVYRRNNRRTPTRPWGTPDITLTRLLQQPSTTTYCGRLQRNSVKTDSTEPLVATKQSFKRWWSTLSDGWPCLMADPVWWLALSDGWPCRNSCTEDDLHNLVILINLQCTL